MILYILIALAVASFVVAFFSARTWHWAYVLVVEALFLATLGFFILSAEVVRINAVLRSAINKSQRELDIVDAQNDALLNGTNNATVIGQLGGIQDPAPVKMPEGAESIPSIEQLDHELLIATRLRGKVWRDVRPVAPPDANSGAVTVAVPTPIRTTDADKPVVYVFEQGAAQPAAGAQRGAQYLGEFSVAPGPNPQQVRLQPVLEMDEVERRRLASSRGPWIMYETMPLDRHEIFAGKTDEELQKLLPKQSIQEYLRDGKPATADDDPLRVVGLDENGNRLPPAEVDKAVKKVYTRRLRDYAAEFDEMARRRVVLLTEIDALKKDIARLTGAQQEAEELQAFREDEKKKLTGDLAGINKEREAIDAHVAQLNKQLARARELTADLMRRNEQLASELAARQLRPRPPGSGSSPQSKPTTPLALGQ